MMNWTCTKQVREYNIETSEHRRFLVTRATLEHSMAIGLAHSSGLSCPLIPETVTVLSELFKHHTTPITWTSLRCATQVVKHKIDTLEDEDLHFAQTSEEHSKAIEVADLQGYHFHDIRHNYLRIRPHMKHATCSFGNPPCSILVDHSTPSSPRLSIVW